MFALLVAAVAPGAAATGGVNWSADPAPNFEEKFNVTKDTHDMSWGTSHADALKYEGDDGGVETLSADVNTSRDNPYSYVVTDINFSDAGAFPHSKDNVSALDAIEWTSATSDSTNVTPSKADTTTAPGVGAVQFSTTDMGAGDTATFTFSNFSIANDIEKRHVQAALDVNSASTGATGEFRLVDGDGDYYAESINNVSGDGYLFQSQIGSMTLNTAGDGTFGTAQKVEFVVADADMDVSVSALNFEKMSKWDLGTEKKDTDSDDDLEDVEHMEVTADGAGAISVHSLGTLGSAFDSAILHDVTFEAIQSGDDLDSSNVVAEYNETGDKYPGYHGTATIYVRMGLPSAYDLSFANAELRDTQAVTNDRIMSVEYAEGVADDTDLKNVSDSSYTDKTDLYTGEDASISLDTTIQPGQNGQLKIKMKLTESQLNNLQNTGGAAGGAAGGSGGLSSLPLIGGIIAFAAMVLKRIG